jgi:hypothetical protein
MGSNSETEVFKLCDRLWRYRPSNHAAVRLNSPVSQRSGCTAGSGPSLEPWPFLSVFSGCFAIVTARAAREAASSRGRRLFPRKHSGFAASPDPASAPRPGDQHSVRPFSREGEKCGPAGTTCSQAVSSRNSSAFRERPSAPSTNGRMRSIGSRKISVRRFG